MSALIAARLAWDIAWAFSFKTLPIRRSTEFKYGDYGGFTAGGQLFSPVFKISFLAVGVKSFAGGGQMMRP
jgi:hypothetical protein